MLLPALSVSTWLKYVYSTQHGRFLNGKLAIGTVPNNGKNDDPTLTILGKPDK